MNFDVILTMVALVGVAALLYGFILGIIKCFRKEERRKGIFYLIGCGGVVVVYSVVLIQLLEIGTGCSRIISQIVKYDLHNLYLSCNTYWAEARPDKQCSLEVVKNEEYGYTQNQSAYFKKCFPSYNYRVEVFGNENTFKATAFVSSETKNDFRTFEINAKGSIRESAGNKVSKNKP